MVKGELKFLEETIDRNCFFCSEKSAGIVAGENGDFYYKIPHCPSHKEEAKKKVSQLM